MKANSRRRVLISSVAMLLVAIVALGTATYAWFTSSTTTTANGLNVKTVQSSELVISKSDRVWGQTVAYGKNNAVLRPVSSADGSSWFSGTAAKKDNFAIDSTKTFSTVTTNDAGSYYFADELNIANKGAAAVTGVKISISGFDSNYGRIALVPVNASGAIDTSKYDTFADAFAANIIDTDGAAYNAVTGTASNATTSITPSTTKEIQIGELAGKAEGAELGGTAYYKLFVWFEGQDQQCVDGNAGQPIGDITFTISGSTKSE